MITLNNNKTSGVGNNVAMKHNKSLEAVVAAQTCVCTVGTAWTYIYSVCTVWSYVCTVCTGMHCVDRFAGFLIPLAIVHMIMQDQT